MKVTSYGDVRGQGPVRRSVEAAERDIDRDDAGCQAQGGYSDRRIAYIGADGYLYADEACEEPIWPSHGRSSGAVRAV